MIINENIAATVRVFLSLQKNFLKNFTPRRKVPKLLLLNFLAKFLKERKHLMNNLTLVRQKISLDEIIKFINSQTNNISTGKAGRTAEFYKHFSNKLAPVLLDVYDS